MIFTEKFRINLHQQPNINSIICTENSIYLTERNNYLTKYNFASGEKEWKINVKETWGWSYYHKGNIYYLSDHSLVYQIDCQTGNIVKSFKPFYFYIGYILVEDSYYITGGWRGYTDLMCFNSENRLLWKFPLSNKKIVNIDLPIIHKKQVILINYSESKLFLLSINTGKVIDIITIPTSISSKDLGHTALLRNDSIFIFSKNQIFSFNVNTKKVSSIFTHSTCIFSLSPVIIDKKLFFQDIEENLICLDLNSYRIEWKTKYNNNFRHYLYIEKLDESNYILGTCFGEIFIIDQSGIKTNKLKTEKRLTSNFYCQNRQICFTTKGELVSYTFN